MKSIGSLLNLKGHIQNYLKLKIAQLIFKIVKKTAFIKPSQFEFDFQLKNIEFDFINMLNSVIIIILSHLKLIKSIFVYLITKIMIKLSRIIFNFTTQISNIVKAQIPLQDESVRLTKWLSLKSICSRREAQQIIKLGLVRINGKRIFQNTLIPYNAQMKAFTQSGIKQQKPITKLWMINKPRQYICTKSDPQKRKTIYQLFPKDYFGKFGHLMTVGRLDYNSEGLLLVTNDSVLKQFLQNPQNDFPRKYEVKVHGRVTPQKMQKMNSPMMIKGQPYGPLRARIIRQLSTNVWLDVIIKTGKNRQVRKILQKCDLQVNKLVRKQYGPFSLKNLQHKSIMQLQIPAFIDKKLKKQRVKLLTGDSSTLIQIDIREKALQFAQKQIENKRLMNQQQENKQISEGKKGKQKLVSNQIKQNKQDQSQDHQE